MPTALRPRFDLDLANRIRLGLDGRHRLLNAEGRLRDSLQGPAEEEVNSERDWAGQQCAHG